MQSQTHRAVLDRLFYDVQADGDLDALPELVHDDVTISSIAFEGAYEGLDDYRQHFEMMSAAFDEIEVSYEVLAAGDDTLTVESRLEGVHVGPFMDVPATGNRVSYPSMAVITFEDGRITSIRSALDLFKLLGDLDAVSFPTE